MYNIKKSGGKVSRESSGYRAQRAAAACMQDNYVSSYQ